MNLSFSNIAWLPEQDEMMYAFLQEQGFTGLEIAPTRIFPGNPYQMQSEAKAFAKRIKNTYGLAVSSMQSVWYGRNESIFGTDSERNILIDYTEKAIDFAAALSCRNIVFGCPKNRLRPDGADIQTADEFFKTISSYAEENGVTIALEPNPAIYGTNFINTTQEAFDYAKKVGCLAVNMDLGTVIENSESIQNISGNIDTVAHIHISEPHLATIKERSLHGELYETLKKSKYSKYVSVEMKYPGNIEDVMQAARYVRGIFI